MTFYTGGSERVRVDTSGNVGIGTSSPNERVTIAASTSGSYIQICDSSTGTTSGDGLFIGSFNGAAEIKTKENKELQFGTNNTERARIDSGGKFLIGTTSTGSYKDGTLNVNGFATFTTSSAGVASAIFNNDAASGTRFFTNFVINASVVGSINSNGTSTTYSTSSDYRLKHDIQPMTGALDKVAQLKPVTYKWNSDNSESQGFIAHELQEVVPDCVTGEKDAVDADGNPVYQGIDTSFLVATLTAAIQEQQQMIETLQAKVAALEAR
jgi:hypothetical protein